MKPPQSRRRFQFSLIGVFVVIALICVGPLWWLRSQMEGRLELGDIDIGTGPGATLAFQCSTTSDAGSFANDFEEQAFRELFQNALSEKDKDTPLGVYRGTEGDCFFIKCDFTRWGRNRLHFPSFRYYSDVNDPGEKSEMMRSTGQSSPPARLMRTVTRRSSSSNTHRKHWTITGFK